MYSNQNNLRWGYETIHTDVEETDVMVAVGALHKTLEILFTSISTALKQTDIELTLVKMFL